MRRKILITSLLLLAAGPAAMQVAVSEVHISINLGAFPDLQPVPGYPVYYAPQMDSNYFFYDGRYWVYQDDNWYASNWYNGPWDLVDPEAVPLYVLRVPVRYYRRPPAYFRVWRADAPPRWDQHWGPGWAQHHRNWDHWNRQAAPKPAPLPTYQRQYSGPRYPAVKEQQELHSRNYQYQPHEEHAHAPPPPQKKDDKKRADRRDEDHDHGHDNDHDGR